MALNLTDLYLIHAMDDRNEIRSRAKNIEDNFGVKAMEIGEFRKQDGGFSFTKGLAVAAAVGLGVGLLAGLAFTAGTAAIIGITIGALAGKITMANQNEKVMKDYSRYLDETAAQARALRDRSPNRSQDVEYNNGNGRKSYTAELSAEHNAYAGQAR